MGGCSVKNCKSSSYKKGMRLFRFPRNESRRKIWAQVCQREFWEPTNNSRLCSLHFTDDQFENSRVDGWKKLKPNAVPTVFVAAGNKSKSRRQNVLLDHSYTEQNTIFSEVKPETYVNILRANYSSRFFPLEHSLNKCAVAVCSNSLMEVQSQNLNITFYKFPKDEKVRNCWIEACKRKDIWNPDTSAVCSIHFFDDDFELDLNEILNLKNKRKLKRNAIPTLHLQGRSGNVEELVIKFEQYEDTTTEEEIVIKCDPDEKPLENKYRMLQDEHAALRCKYEQQMKKIEHLEEKVSELTKRLDDECNNKKQLEEILRYIYSDQKKDLNK